MSLPCGSMAIKIFNASPVSSSTGWRASRCSVGRTLFSPRRERPHGSSADFGLQHRIGLFCNRNAVAPLLQMFSRCCKMNQIIPGSCQRILMNIFIWFWRMGWDSNPRYGFPHAGFQDRFLKPLGHPSISVNCCRFRQKWRCCRTLLPQHHRQFNDCFLAALSPASTGWDRCRARAGAEGAGRTRRRAG